MFRKGGSVNEGIMHGLERRGYAESNWEDLAKAYNISGSDRFSGESDLYKNIDPDLINTGEGYGTNWIKWLSDRLATDYQGPQTIHQVALEEAAEANKYPDLSETIMEKGPPGGTQLPYYKMPPPKKKPPGTTGGAEGYPEGSFEARKHRLSERAKEYANLMHPMAKERLIAGSLAAASESFEKSTGNTWQDIARAISAAAKASDPTEIYGQGARLALQEDIELRGIREAAKAKSLYRDYAPSEKIKTVNALVAGGMNRQDAIDKVFGANNIYANVAEASSKEPGVPESSINIAAGQTYKNYKGQVDPDEWDEFKDQLEDGVYKVGKKIYRIKTVDGKKQPPELLADFASTKI